MAYDVLDDKPRTIAGSVAASSQEAKDFLARGRERFKIAVDAENKFRMKALDDMRFRVGKQWPGETETQRQEENRPCLTINRMPAIINGGRCSSPTRMAR